MESPAQTQLLEVPGKEAGLEESPEYDAALERAGRWLALRARTEQELSERLEQGGFTPGVVARVLARLKEVGLIDDAAFAREWIEERTRRKDAGPVLLAAELRAKGVDEAVAALALDEAFPDESDRAAEVAAGLIGKWAELSPAKQAARLASALARKGFSSEAVEEGLRAVLPPEGWD